jgi:hypothetical protein
MEDRKTATRMVEHDLTRMNIELARVGAQRFDPNNPPENTNGTNVLFNFLIGRRDCLTKAAARHGGEEWCKIFRRYPKAKAIPHMAGFDEDPRQIWEIVEAARYVRWWARYAGIIRPEDPFAVIVPECVGFLTACAVFGEELRQGALANTNPTTRN